MKKVLASYGPDLVLWNLHRTGKSIDWRILNAHDARILSLTKYDPFRYISTSYDRLVKIWNLRTQSVFYTFPKQDSLVNSTCVNTTGDMLATCSGEPYPEIRLWKKKDTSFEKIGVLNKKIQREHELEVLQASFVGNNRMVSIGYSGRIVLWDLEKSCVIQRRSVGATGGKIINVGDKSLITSTSYSEIFVHSLKNLKLLRKINIYGSMEIRDGGQSNGDIALFANKLLVSVVGYRRRRIQTRYVNYLTLWDLSQCKMISKVLNPKQRDTRFHVVKNSRTVLCVEKCINVWKITKSSAFKLRWTKTEEEIDGKENYANIGSAFVDNYKDHQFIFRQKLFSCKSYCDIKIVSN